MKKFLSNINVIKRVFVMAALAVIAFVPAWGFASSGR